MSEAGCPRPRAAGPLRSFGQNTFATNGAVGTAFVDRANLNQYADTNNTIVLYPQAIATGANPNGCWDWWGYLGATNYPIKGGAQVETIMNMVRRLDG